MSTGKDEKINYKFHIVAVAFLVLFEAFSPQIFSSAYQPILNYWLNSQNGKSGSLYSPGDNHPLSKDAPSKYRYVFVEERGNVVKEMYYLPNLGLKEIVYRDGTWESTSTTYLSTKFFLLLPSVGFLLIFYAIFSHSLRTNQWLSFYDFWKYPYIKREKVCLIYGVPLFAFSAFLGPIVV